MFDLDQQMDIDSKLLVEPISTCFGHLGFLFVIPHVGSKDIVMPSSQRIIKLE